MQQQPQPQRKNKKILYILLVIVALMFAFGFALVPIYNVLCQVTGLNGKTAGPVVSATNNNSNANNSNINAASTTTNNKNAIDERWVTVEFVATNNDRLPWKFYPEQKKVKIHPGQQTRISYYAKNLSKQTMIIQAIPSVTPGIAAQYLKKLECFCFREQTLKAGEAVSMPVVFHIDNKIPNDIHTITLSYTLFDRTQLHQQQTH